MFEKFVEKLCEREGLIDVGQQGKPSQSSYSKWSSAKDEYGPISDKEFQDYAFHTKKEMSPWWKIDFEEPKNIRYVIINNRKRAPFDKIADNLLVEGVTESNQSVILHKGNINFGSLPQSLPLVLLLDVTLKLKQVKVSLPSNNPLHLCRIYFLAKRKSFQANMGKPVFFSNRFDGFGERLRALLNTIIAAELYQGEFFFSWVDRGTGFNQFHSTANHNDIFSEKFVNDHLMEKDLIDRMDLINSQQLYAGNIEKLLSYDGILMDRHHIAKQVNSELLKAKGYNYKDAFDKIEFSDELMKAKNDSKNILSNQKSVAIHLRSGDIVYGAYRLAGQAWDKVVPIYVLDNLIRHYKSKGYQIVIFGQDADFCKELSFDYDIIYSANFMEQDYTISQESLFDITLMSQCEIIIAGNSGFATISSWIGNSLLVSYKEIVSNQDQISNFKKLINNPKGIFNYTSMSNLLKSFTILHFYFNFHKMLTTEDKVYFIGLCRQLDPENTFVSLLFALALYESLNTKEADKIIRSELHTKKKYDFIWLATQVRPDHVTVLSKYHDELKNAASKGSHVAGTLVLYNEYYFYNSVNDNYYIELIRLGGYKEDKEFLINKFEELTGKKLN